MYVCGVMRSLLRRHDNGWRESIDLKTPINLIFLIGIQISYYNINGYKKCNEVTIFKVAFQPFHKYGHL